MSRMLSLFLVVAMMGVVVGCPADPADSPADTNAGDDATDPGDDAADPGDDAADPRDEQVDTDQELSVRQRLQQAIDVTRELNGKARCPTKTELGDRRLSPLFEDAYARGERTTAMFPPSKAAAELRCSLFSEVARYEQQRPWTTRYFAISRYGSHKADKPKWPGPTDAPQLRELLGDDNRVVRSLAVEALATLHLPEDIPRIARLLDDESDGLPILGRNRNTSSIPTFSFGEPPPDTLDVMRSWHACKVQDYAWLALRLTTGQSFTSASFAPWWERNQNPRHRLWYWKQRLQNEIDEAGAISHVPYSAEMDRDTFAQLKAGRAVVSEVRKDAVRRKTAEELRRLPAEVEAKVRLLITHYGGFASDFFYSDVPWQKIGPLRLSPERLLDLLDRKDLWEDVDWKCSNEGYGPYNHMVQRLMLAAPDIFGPEHADRLRAVLAREGESLPGSGRAALLIGISRLLPPAGPDNLDDIATRDGTLRSAIRDGSCYAACELIQVGLPQNWPFLKEAFFTTPGRQHMISALGEEPLTAAKRTALCELLLEERFKPLWNANRWCRASALRAVNAHAGEEIFPEPSPSLDKPAIPDHVFHTTADVVEFLKKRQTP